MEETPLTGVSTPTPALATTPAPLPEPEAKKGGFASETVEFIWETLKVVIISLVIILPIRYFLIQPFFVQGSSMVPNFQNHEYILVDKWTYRLGRPERGDVIVFKYPANPQEYFIKRIIGLPGETVLVPGDNTVKVFNSRYPNGFMLNEKSYLPDANRTYCSTGTSTWCGRKVTLGPTQYFVMGDNREHSSDSRFFGPVDVSYFSGMAWLRLWPLDTITFIPRTEYPPVVQ